MSEQQSASVRGDVAAGFEAVEDAFRTNFTERNELGAACAVYHRGQKVVDLWGGYRDIAATQPWEEDTMVLVFSTTKGVSAIAMALAHARNYFEYDDEVSSHWPSFGQNGKDAVTVRELLDHQAGVAAIDENLTPEKIGDRAALMDLLAAKQPDWEPGTRHGYHAFSLGWYESELLRQTDPQDRRLGQFLAEEIAAPLDMEFYISLPESVDEDRIAEIDGFHPLAMVKNMHTFPWRMVLAFLNPKSVTTRSLSPFEITTPAELNEPAFRAVEIPAGNGIGQVRDLAKLYGLLATGGTEIGLTHRTFDELIDEPNPPTEGKFDVVLKTETSYNLGFGKPHDRLRFGSPQAFGTHGAGGSFAFADPDRELGFAYAPNRMGTYLRDDPRERSLREAAIECIDTR